MGTLPLNAVAFKDVFASSVMEALVAETPKSLVFILFMMGSLLNGVVLLSMGPATFEWFLIPKHHALKQSDTESKDASDTEDDEEDDDDADDQDDDDDQDDLSREEGNNKGDGDPEEVPQANGDGASEDDEEEEEEDDDDDDDDDGSDDGDEEGEEEEEEEDEEEEEEEIPQPPAKRRK